MSSGAAAVARRAALDVGIEGFRLIDLRLGGEHHVGGARGELAAGLRRARLRHHRPALRRARDVERALDLEVLADVVEEMDLVAVHVDAALLVAQQPAVFPAVPQAGDDLVELLGALVALGVGQVLVEAEILRLVLDLRGHQVPAGAAAADMVDRGEAAGDVVGLVVGRGRRRHEADVVRDHGERRQRRRRLELDGARELGAGALAAGQRAAAGHAHRVLEEDGVELGGLGDLGDVGVLLEVHVRRRDRIGMAPAREMVAGHAEEAAEPELPASGHGGPMRQHCHPRRVSEGPLRPQERSLASLGMTAGFGASTKRQSLDAAAFT